VLLGGFAAAAVVFYQARAQSTEFFDYQLRQLALTLRDRDYTVRELAQALRGQQDLDFVIQVWGPDGRLLYGSHPQIDVPAPAGPGFSDAVTPTGRWRIFSIWHRGLTIQVAQHKLAREALAVGAALRTLLPFVLVLPLMGYLIWRLVGREVRFLESTARAVASRSPESLQPIEGEAVPDEIRPLVNSLNDLLARLGTALSQQRQFIADAAHELRTPLTALKLQLQLAQRARDATEREKALATLGDGITRATHVVEQLLTMARQDPAAQAIERRPVDLDAVVSEAVEAERPIAGQKGLSLVLDSRLRGSEIAGDRVALRALVENLVDNAIRYTPSGSVTVRTYPGPNEAVFEVEDTGPGIPVEERERVFDRFYRGQDAAEGGSGLGLSIVRRIAERHGAKVELADRPGGPGLLARVRFTLSPS
jgi:two-component system OmpR family sensor kinase